MVSALESLRSSVGREVAVNERLRAGLWAVTAILLIYWLLVQSDRKAAAYRDYAASTTAMSQAESVLSREDWPELLAAVRATQQRLAERFWRANSPGQAQAQVQAALTEIVADTRYRDTRIQAGLTERIADVPGVLRVQFRLSSTYQPGAELQLLQAIAHYPKKLIVDSLDLRRANSRLVMLLSAYFIDVGPTDEEPRE